MITDIEDYVRDGCGRCARFATPDCSVRHWQEAVLALRALCRDAGLGETVKWGHPCYVHAGRNIAIIGAVRGGARLGFFNAALLSDPAGLLERQGPNTRHPDTVRVTSAARVHAIAPDLRACLDEAMRHAEAGTRPPPATAEPDLPDDLVEALAADSDLAAAFDALTPGRRRSYAIALASAKRAETRQRRIAAFRDRILAGKGATER
ncbi:hypothetical protein ROJ8625_01776 [Roseivivax jejudonensis]|uniref:YdhG-like domain-containing protein n=1 Tax=Roseivivax jejudonensis TaxID=1529041 RepID=A0A1X6Z2F8_9RHOB|nr:YdeI/OmpD-associated family protein [Roseivivax jejudonensis]SLN38541.1 hypothetical protein ROJ8625_01776 [Roseivivax jejudonensis]